ncbi:MAG: hypothetical protein AAF483_01550 [Planctomycetota bacterium]
MPKTRRTKPTLISTILLEGIALIAILTVARPEIAKYFFRRFAVHASSQPTQNDIRNESTFQKIESPLPEVELEAQSHIREEPNKEVAESIESPSPGFYPRQRIELTNRPYFVPWQNLSRLQR